jgi:hypothetical protein
VHIIVAATKAFKMSREEQVLTKVAIANGLHAGKTFSQEYDISQGYPPCLIKQSVLKLEI